MRDWPPITEPELLERLGWDDERFFAFVEQASRAIGRREFRRELYERALAYPWERPGGSYVLRDEGSVELLGEMRSEHRAAALHAFTSERHPIVSFGANAAPSALRMKFGHFPDPQDRETLVLTGHLNGVDVGPISAPGMMGYVPAALFASPGTAVRAAVTWVTPAQVTQLTWSELSYRLGRLEDVRFEMDEADAEVNDLFAYVSRFGVFCIDGDPVALAAVPARHRSAPAFSQEELLDLYARLLLGPASRAEELVRAVFDDIAAMYERGKDTILPQAQQLQCAWTPFPVDGP